MLRKPEDTALYELDSRISAMERRLKNAKAARVCKFPIKSQPA